MLPCGAFRAPAGVSCIASIPVFAVRLNTDEREKYGHIKPTKTPYKVHRVTKYGTPLRTSREPAGAKNRSAMRGKKYWREMTVAIA